MNVKRLSIIENWTNSFTMHKNLYGEWYGLIMYTPFSIPQSTDYYKSLDDATDQAYAMVNEYIWNLTY
jgi:hypothetical protein